MATTETRIVTGEVRLSYANIWEPKSIQGGAPKYSVSLIIPKEDQATLTAINRAIDAVWWEDPEQGCPQTPAA